MLWKRGQGERSKGTVKDKAREGEQGKNSVVVVVVEDFGSWVLPPSLNCSLAPCPSTLTRLALWAELFQQKIQSTVAKADRREPTVWFLRVLLQLAVKEGTISYSILFGM